MLASEALDDITAYADNTGPTDPANNPRRKRHLKDMLRVLGQIRGYRDWAFARSYAVLTVANGVNYAALPADFLNLGGFGGVWDLDASGAELDHTSEFVIEDCRARQRTASSIYSIYGGKLQLATAEARRLAISYITKLPEITDSAANGGDDTKDANLAKALPAEYHETVLIPGMRAKARESIGDARWQNDRDEFHLGLKLMLRTCRRFQGTPQQMPSAFGG